MATENQALALLKLGFNESKNPRKRKRDFTLRKGRESSHHIMEYYARMMLRGVGRQPSSVGYIVSKLSDKQAGVLIRIMATLQGKKRDRHKPLPERPAMNTNADHNAKIVEEIIAEKLPK